MPLNMELSRRDFLRTLTVVGAAVLLPLTGLETDAAPVGKFVPVGKPTDFKEGQWRAVTLPGGDLIFVRRMGAKKPVWMALSSKCTHKGCTVGWNADAQVFNCPCHRGQFNADGKNIGGPPPRPLDALPIKIVGGKVLVEA